MKNIITLIISCVFLCSSCISAHGIKMYKPPEEKSIENNGEDNRAKYEKYKLSFGQPDNDILRVSPCFIQGNYESLKDLNVRFPLPRRTMKFNELMPDSYLLIDELLAIDNTTSKIFKEGVSFEKASDTSFSVGMFGLSVTLITPVMYTLSSIGSMFSEIPNNKVDSEPFVIAATIGASVFISGLVLDIIFSSIANRKYNETTQSYNQYLKEYYEVE